MIYAIRAVGTSFVKIGRAANVGRRMQELETGCPHELHLEASAPWPDGQETAIHAYLRPHCEKYEWFRDSDATARVLDWLNDPGGLELFMAAWRHEAGFEIKLRPKRVKVDLSAPTDLGVWWEEKKRKKMLLRGNALKAL